MFPTWSIFVGHLTGNDVVTAGDSERERRLRNNSVDEEGGRFTEYLSRFFAPRCPKSTGFLVNRAGSWEVEASEASRFTQAAARLPIGARLQTRTAGQQVPTSRENGDQPDDRGR